jgi:acyl-CoA thioesterase-1
VHPVRSTVSYSLAAALAAPASAAASPSGGSTAVASRRIVVLGDSLAVSPSHADNFPAELQARLRTAHPGWTVVNASYRGDTTTGAMRRFEQELARDTQVLVLALGANDGLRGVDVRTVEQNLSRMIEAAQARGVKVLLCGMETPPLKGWNYTLAFHGIYPRLAARYKVPLVPFLLAGVALNAEMNGADQIHPNAAGARLIADTVWPFLEPLL